MTFDELVYLVVRWACLGLAAWALVDALIRPAEAYVAAGKLTKAAWLGITGVALVLLYAIGPLSFLGLPAVIGAVVYLVDVRPAIRGLKRGNSSW
ncbi:DUF2516 family protein [Modestobacter sp. I12A-02628]|uniref:DUF2516 family protein n=1 Tax=Goekera deserti TaxID=2497753 RepID=A0A7K3W959_9ACTN|nr:DUF2516 family protein [Goekera deserti]MPR00463.1 DUF2516 family protein [Goekera deserti]NDI49139.1 DUF2516 family protein [Goekera deserti]NEL52877.1 DUF2516 family protein [Goekera deserti]